MIDDGIELEYPPEFKWDQNIVKDPNFIHKINADNVGMMHESLQRLVKKSSVKSLKKENSDQNANLEQDT